MIGHVECLALRFTCEPELGDGEDQQRGEEFRRHCRRPVAAAEAPHLTELSPFGTLWEHLGRVSDPQIRGKRVCGTRGDHKFREGVGGTLWDLLGLPKLSLCSCQYRPPAPARVRPPRPRAAVLGALIRRPLARRTAVAATSDQKRAGRDRIPK